MTLKKLEYLSNGVNSLVMCEMGQDVYRYSVITMESKLPWVWDSKMMKDEYWVLPFLKPFPAIGLLVEFIDGGYLELYAK